LNEPNLGRRDWLTPSEERKTIQSVAKGVTPDRNGEVRKTNIEVLRQLADNEYI
jgi:hypothetical protein